MAKNTTSTHTLRLRADASQAKAGLDQIDKELKDVVRELDRARAAAGSFQKATAGTGKQINAAASSTRRLAQEKSALAKQTKQMRSQYQNLGYQLQDTVIQLEMGTHWTRVFAQQGSQVLGAFGPWPAILSAAGAAVVVLGSAFLSASKDFDVAIESMEGLEEASTAFLDAFSVSDMSFDQLNAEFGKFGQEIKALSEIVTSLRFDEYVAGTVQAAEATDTAFDRVRHLVKQLDEAAEKATKAGWNETARAVLRYDVVLAKLEDTLGLTAREARGLVKELDAVASGTITDFEDIIEVTNRMVAAFSEIWGEDASKWPKEIKRLVTALNAQALDAARTAAETSDHYVDVLGTVEGLAQAQEAVLEIEGKSLEAEMAIVEQAKKLVAIMRDEAPSAFQAANTAAGDLLGTMSKAAMMAYYTTLGIARGLHREQMEAFGGEGDKYYSVPTTYKPPKTTKSGGGGGGKSETEKEIERQRELQKEFDKSIAAAQLFGRTMEEDFGNLASSALDQFIDGLVEGQFAFKDFARSVLQDLAKIMLRAIIVNQLLRMAGIQPGTSATDMTGFQRVIAQVAGLSIPNAKGNIISGGNVVPFAHGGVVSSPTLFPMASGTGLMGEAGPEVIAPLRRDGAGNMGVGAVAPVVNVHNYSGQPVDVASGPGGQVDVIVGMARNAVQEDFSRSLSTGQGAYARAIEGGINARRKYG